MADPTVRIVIDAINKGSKVITDLKNDLKGVEGASGKTSAALGTLKSALGTAGVMGAAVAVGNFIKKSVTDWSAYAESIQKAAQNAGVSTEEMSRLIQASDDFRVSQEALESAMVMALKNGFEPTIENIAKLSDEYLAIESPAERAAFATKIFGRQYAEITPLLLQGGDAIRQGTAAIADNLVVTEDAMKQNKEYIAALDALNDSWAGLTYTVGQSAIPTITSFLNLLQSFSPETAADFINTALGGEDKMFMPTKEAKELYEQVQKIKEAYKTAEPAGKDMNEMLAQQKWDAEAAGEGVQGVADATNNAADAMKKYNEQLLFTIASEELTQEEAYNLMITMGLADNATVTATEKQKQFKEMLDWGKISIETYNALIAGLRDRIGELQSKEIDVTTNFYENYYRNDYSGYHPTGDTTVTPQASGGSVIRGGNYRWQEYGYQG